ncbi:MAG: hypothetical protein GY838_14020 [bacterium]|nr:hypothetical protein [bacterium]
MNRTIKTICFCIGVVAAGLGSAAAAMGQPLAESTFFGGADSENINDLTVDAQGNILVVGYTSSADLPMLAGSWDPTFAALHDAFVAKFSPDLSELLAVTYLGGDGVDHAYRVVVDSVGQVLISGFTDSTDLPATGGAYDHGGAATDGFVARFDADLTTLLDMVRIGGTGSDYAYSIVIDGAGRVYLAGETSSNDLPVTGGAYATSRATGSAGHTDFFVSCFSADLTTLVASTYLGGNDLEIHSDLGLDPGGDVVLLGATQSGDFPTTEGAWDRSHNGSADVVVARLSADLTTLLHATLLGGSSYDRPFDLAQDGSGRIYLVGYTHSANYPRILPAYDNYYSQPTDAVVSRLSADLSTLEASTLLGRAGTEYGTGIGLRSDGSVYVTGMTDRSSFPVTPDAFDPVFNGLSEGFVACLDGSLRTLETATFIGGVGDEWGGLWMEGDDILLAGSTGAVDFPVTAGSYSQENSGGGDAYVTRLTSLSVSAVPSQEGGGQQAAPWTIESISPNPFNPQTVVRFRVDEPGWLAVQVYDVSGTRVGRLASGHYPAGTHTAVWNGRDERGRNVPSGTYLVGLQGASGSIAAGETGTAKMQLVR